ncbi:CHRD domain-containing protein [Streptomyces roseoverticillatus]|uniref:CHRD domain-containing protein n=1 Tax=Streptomyces roseoverticillatus TaxID=66429 RepID=UPI001F20E0AC|nr:CHRD domain-containing protein [Streptomyces roseoverticillatus]MCF3104566.1 CHRD domain-containing protein [Streptomyces roseoverticillatus]
MNRIGKRRTIIATATAAAVAAGVGIAFAVAPGEEGGPASGAAASSPAHSGHGGSLGPVSSPNHEGAVFFAGSLNGANEVPAADGKATGDKDGQAVAFLRVQGDEVSFAFSFRGIATPTAAHLHQGERGKNGDVRIPFFAQKLPDGRTSATGTVKVTDRKLLDALASGPGGFYFNLHTGEFPGGAVRGQVHRLSAPLDMNSAVNAVQASVVEGRQIYACRKQDGGGFAFAQDNVSATLDGNIAHSFVRPGGDPQWVAPDRSAVTGKVVTKTPNGDGNIPELDLRATRSGAETGILASTTEILRLNTRGGVAPAGPCDPQRQPAAAVPYRADYVFIGR